MLRSHLPILSYLMSMCAAWKLPGSELAPEGIFRYDEHTIMEQEAENPFLPEFFRREDESNDSLFYKEPRLLVHIDDHAIEAVGEYFSEALPHDGLILDLMSSWRTHLPDDFVKDQLVGLGLNAVELAENPQLDHRIVQDINTLPELPFRDSCIHAVVVTVSIQYMIHPVELFREINRVLEDRGSFHIIYSNRMFGTKAVSIWKGLDDFQRGQLLTSYFAVSTGWEQPKMLDITPKLGTPSDPVYVVSARKLVPEIAD